MNSAISNISTSTPSIIAMQQTYSGRQITQAGRAFLEYENLVKNESEFNKVMEVLSFWRLCHEDPLNYAWDALRAAVGKHDQDALFAKRLKRYISIYYKLTRFEKMTLRNMQDIGGCRAIISSERKLRRSVRDLKLMPNFQTSEGSYRSKDYIKKPKSDGYRGYHLVGRFSNGIEKPRNIEIQLRTKIQHYWATALEIIDLFTGQALKSNQGQDSWSRFFVEASRQLAVMDEVPKFHSLTRQEKLRRYHSRVRSNPLLVQSCLEAHKRMGDLRVVKKFTAYANSIEIIDKKIHNSPDSAYVLLTVDIANKKVHSKVFTEDRSKAAERSYIKAEKAAAQVNDQVVALVSTSVVGGIKEAYPNFFADSSEFLYHLDIIRVVAEHLKSVG